MEKEFVKNVTGYIFLLKIPERGLTKTFFFFQSTMSIGVLPHACLLPEDGGRFLPAGGKGKRIRRCGRNTMKVSSHGNNPSQQTGYSVYSGSGG